MLNAATLENIQRKSVWADHVQLHEGIPLFSWLDLSITEWCDLKCPFCSRANPSEYPNQALHMPVPLAQKIANELRELDYQGCVVLSGYGEPLMHPRVVEIVEAFSDLHIELVTNGNALTAAKVRALLDAGISQIVVSLYVGPEQVSKMRAVFDAADCPVERYSLRDRWYGPEEDYGLKLTNRAGMVVVGNQPPVDPTRPCAYPSYAMQLDWDGTILLCPQDWKKRIKFGSVAHQPLWEVWKSKSLHKRRTKLMQDRQGLVPCEDCNVDGCLHGVHHIAAWQEMRRSP